MKSKTTECVLVLLPHCSSPLVTRELDSTLSLYVEAPLCRRHELLLVEPLLNTPNITVCQ